MLPFIEKKNDPFTYWTHFSFTGLILCSSLLLSYLCLESLLATTSILRAKVSQRELFERGGVAGRGLRASTYATSALTIEYVCGYDTTVHLPMICYFYCNKDFYELASDKNKIDLKLSPLHKRVTAFRISSATQTWHHFSGFIFITYVMPCIGFLLVISAFCFKQVVGKQLFYFLCLLHFCMTTGYFLIVLFNGYGTS